MYERELENKLLEKCKYRKVVLLTGPRGVGKKTLLRKVKKDITFVTLGNLTIRKLALEDPKLFMMTYRPPLIIDEVQYAPNILSLIKLEVDESNEKGLYLLTGSQKFHLMKNVSESLAGRIGILEMTSLSYREKHNLPVRDFDPRNINKSSKDINIIDLFNDIFEGGMPEYCFNKLPRNDFFNDYIKTYIERDVRDLTQVGNTISFEKFLVSVASRNGELVNYKSIAEDAGIDEKTAALWLSILVSSDIIYLLQPYLSSELKRTTKTPKIVFMDSGICSYLCKWDSGENLMNSTSSGHYLETYLISELIKNKRNNKNGLEYNIYFYRDRDGKEIDLICEFNNTLHPFEIKKTASPNKSMISNFDILNKTKKNIGSGGLICFYPDIIPLDEKNNVIHISCLF